jgi:hypothetical protein
MERYEGRDPVVVVGQTGKPGPQGIPGETGASSKEDITQLVGAMTGLTAEMGELASAMRILATKFEGNSEATIERVRTAVRLNKLSTAIGLFVLGALIAMVFATLGVQSEVKQIHNTQRVNSTLTKTDNETLQQVLGITKFISAETNPAAVKASDAKIVALLDQEAACVENHGDRARDALAHIKPPPLLAGCSANT